MCICKHTCQLLMLEQAFANQCLVHWEDPAIGTTGSEYVWGA